MFISIITFTNCILSVSDITKFDIHWHATHPLMVVIICGKYVNNNSRTENEWRRFLKSRSNDLEDIGQGQRSYATHLLMLVIICTEYGKNPSRTVDATERTRLPRPNDVEDIGQGHYMQHTLSY